jgi:Flp pilus assembly protein TadB
MPDAHRTGDREHRHITPLPSRPAQEALMRRPRSATSALVAASTILVATHARALLLALIGVLVLVCLGVVLPAVWFGDAHRRRDARAVLQQLLNLARQPRSP